MTGARSQPILPGGLRLRFVAVRGVFPAPQRPFLIQRKIRQRHPPIPASVNPPFVYLRDLSQSLPSVSTARSITSDHGCPQLIRM